MQTLLTLVALTALAFPASAQNSVPSQIRTAFAQSSAQSEAERKREQLERELQRLNEQIAREREREGERAQQERHTAQRIEELDRIHEVLPVLGTKWSATEFMQ